MGDKKMKMKLLALLLALVLFAALLPFASAAGELQASPTAATVTVNGKAVAFDAYNIQGSNYFKLRDLAFTLNGTAKQFSVGWDGANNAISLTSGQAYTADGTEMAGKGSGTKTASPTNAKIYLNGKEAAFTAYNIVGNNHFKLRDIGKAFDFAVTWDDGTKTIAIDTAVGYASRTYTNVWFDYTQEIAALNAKSTGFTVPAAADIGITVADEKGAAGVVIVPASGGSKTEYYLNALVAGNKLIFTGSDIKAVTVKSGTAVTEVPVSGGQFTVTPKTISAAKPLDEIISVTKQDDTVYNIHTLNEFLPGFNVTIGSTKPIAGVYSFTVDKCLLRVDTSGQLVYYRNFAHLSDNGLENFMPQDTPDGRFYTVSLELNPARGGIGFTNGMYIVMDENYKEINYVTLASNANQNHTHGEGYLDDHDFLLLGRDHWISLSYTPIKVDNLPAGGIGGNTAYVQANIIQEVKSGKVLHEYNLADYPELYAAAKENTKYAASAGDKTPNDFLDYTHANSVFIDPKDGNLLVSMRSQYALCKIDRETGDRIWTLGGALNDFKGLESFYDAAGNLFVGQHVAKYVPASIAGNDSTVSVFDNHTSYNANTSRVFVITLDETNKTASATVINGRDLDKLSDKKHWATHCAAFQMETKETCHMGWGSNITLDGNVSTIPTHAMITDYNIAKNLITFELSVTRNSHHAASKDFCFSYRIYKTAE